MAAYTGLNQIGYLLGSLNTPSRIQRFVSAFSPCLYLQRDSHHGQREGRPIMEASVLPSVVYARHEQLPFCVQTA